MKFVSGTESFAFKLSHNIFSWAHSYGTRLRAHFCWVITSPVKPMGCKRNNADVLTVLVQMLSLLERRWSVKIDEKDKWLKRNAERGGIKRNCWTVSLISL